MQLGPYPHQHNGAGILQIQQNQVCPRRESCICRRGHTGIYVPGLVRDWQTYSVVGGDLIRLALLDSFPVRG